MRHKRETVIGIIAEYNPFHNGHKALIDSARKRLGDVPCVVVLSSCFTQRGEPAAADKMTRARMALSCGADLVIELPFIFACSSAPDFSFGAVDILAGTKLATHVVFGMEDADESGDPLDRTKPILDILTREPVSFKQSLHKLLKNGMSYPKAVSLALSEYVPGGGEIISRPNNALGISYIMNIRRRGADLTPLPFPRIGSGHGDDSLGAFASSRAIRASIADGIDGISGAMPAEAFELMRQAHRSGLLCTSSERMWPMLKSLLIRSRADDLRSFDGITEGIEGLFLKHYRYADGFEDFIGRCVCARWTRSSIRRKLVRLLIGTERSPARQAAANGAPYARILGFNERGRTMLKHHDSEIPIITKISEAKGEIGKFAAETEMRASDIYAMLTDARPAVREEQLKPCMM